MLGILRICLRLFFINVSILNEMPILGQAPRRLPEKRLLKKISIRDVTKKLIEIYEQHIIR